jgi:hypothetical protein
MRAPITSPWSLLSIATAAALFSMACAEVHVVTDAQDPSCEVNEDCPSASNLCEGTYVCLADPNGNKVCVIDPESAIQCDTSDDNDCRQTECNSENGECETVTQSDIPCDDGDLCTDNSTCQADGSCVALDDHCACRDDEDCPPPENLCAGVMVCSGDLSVETTCLLDSGQAVVCDTGNDDSCNQTTCDPGTGTCSSNVQVGESCAPEGPSNLCISATSCQADGSCGGGDEDLCDDADPCTTDACQVDSGECFNTPILCLPTGACVTSTCVNGSCEEETSKNFTVCDDGDEATGPDICLSGNCVVGTRSEQSPFCGADSVCAWSNVRPVGASRNSGKTFLSFNYTQLATVELCTSADYTRVCTIGKLGALTNYGGGAAQGSATDIDNSVIVGDQGLVGEITPEKVLWNNVLNDAIHNAASEDFFADYKAVSHVMTGNGLLHNFLIAGQDSGAQAISVVCTLFVGGIPTWSCTVPTVGSGGPFDLSMADKYFSASHIYAEDDVLLGAFLGLKYDAGIGSNWVDLLGISIATDGNYTGLSQPNYDGTINGFVPFGDQGALAYGTEGGLFLCTEQTEEEEMSCTKDELLDVLPGQSDFTFLDATVFDDGVVILGQIWPTMSQKQDYLLYIKNTDAVDDPNSWTILPIPNTAPAGDISHSIVNKGSGGFHVIMTQSLVEEVPPIVIRTFHIPQ